jgi:hypothetical protein
MTLLKHTPIGHSLNTPFLTEYSTILLTLVKKKDFSPSIGDTMSKIVTTFFKDNDRADEFVAKNRDDYCMHVETVSYSRLQRIMKYARYMKARLEWWNHD